MTRYEYKANDISGRTKSGTLMAENMTDFYAKLKEMGLYCLTVAEAANQSEIVDIFASKKKGHKLKLQDISVFCRQFATMLSSGITVVKCLDILYHQAEDKHVKAALLRLYEEIKKGNSLSVAMRDLGSTFPSLLINMIQSGESSGKLDDVMLSMSIHYEKEKVLKGKVKTAMIYPIILLVVAVIVICVLLIFVVPTFMDLFGSADNLPGTTKFLLSISSFMQNYWWLLLIIGVGIAFGMMALLKVPSVKIVFDKMKIRLPQFGKLLMIILTARFARTISTLYSSGMPIIDSIRTSANVLGNLYISSKIEGVIDDIKKGVSLSQALTSADLFPTMFTSMVYIGEESGTLDSILERTADFYDEDASAAISKMVALMEPLLIVLLGGVVAFIVISVAEPMFGMYDYIA